MKMSVKNWNKPAHEVFVLATGIVGSATAFTPQLLSVLHEAPFPVSLTVDAWIEWILKVATVGISAFTIFSRKATNEELK